MIYLINCGKLSPEQHSAVQKLIDSHDKITDWRHCLDSSWFVDMAQGHDIEKLGTEIYELSEHKRVLIGPVYAGHLTGWIHKDAWTWLKDKGKAALPAEAQRDTAELPNEAAKNLRVINSTPDLTDFIGIDDAAAQLKRLVAGIAFRAAARNAGLKLSTGFSNILISGPSGVGKTSLALCAAQMLKDASPAAAKRKIYLVQAADLIDRHVGKSANNTKAVLEAAGNGIVIFDEIDALLDISHYGAEVLNTLNSHIGNAPNKPVIIGTLYTHREHAFRSFNTGLSSRFPHVQKLAAYDDDTLTTIFTRKVEKAGLDLSADTKPEITRLFADLRRNAGNNFGNAREAENLFHATIDNLAERFSELPEESRNAFLQGDSEETLALIKTIIMADLPMRGPGGTLIRRPQTTTPPQPTPPAGGNVRTLTPR
jgi:energy-coupling factor transporter ATP-binding protein EcfA2